MDHLHFAGKLYVYNPVCDLWIPVEDSVPNDVIEDILSLLLGDTQDDHSPTPTVPRGGREVPLVPAPGNTRRRHGIGQNPGGVSGFGWN